MKKEEKNKVGRPKLADSKTKIESILICVFVLVIIAIVVLLEYNILTIDFNPQYTVGKIYNDHVNSCVVENGKINCGPNVTYMKYKIDNKDYVEVNKENDSIEVKLDKYNKINVCYKTMQTDLICNK